MALPIKFLEIRRCSMNKIKKLLKRIWDDESGQGATEYILILVVVSVIVLVFKNKIKIAIGNLTDSTTGKLSDAITNMK